MSSSSQPAPLSLREDLAALLRLAGPIALAQVGQASMGWVDTAVIGRVSAAAQAGVGLGNSIIFTVATLGFGLMAGLDPLISQSIGAGRTGEARHYLWQGLWLALFSAVFLSVIATAVALCLPWAGLPAEVVSEAQSYLFWRLPAYFPMLLGLALKAYLQAIGAPMALLWAALAANVTNAAGDLYWVLGPSPQGVRGVAWATVLSTLLQFSLLAWAASRRKPSPAAVPAGTLPHLRRPQVAALRKAVQVGLPVGLQMLAEFAAFAIAALIAGRLGAEPLAAHQIALTYASLSYCFAVGFGSAGSVRVGWAIGAGMTGAARRSGLVALGAGAAVMSLSAALFISIPEPLARVMTDQPSVLAVAVPLFLVSAAFQLSDGVQGVGAGLLRGAGDTRWPFLFNLVGHYAVGLPLAGLLGFRAGMGVTGVWWGLCAGLTAVATALFVRFWRLTARPIAAL